MKQVLICARRRPSGGDEADPRTLTTWTSPFGLLTIRSLTNCAKSEEQREVLNKRGMPYDRRNPMIEETRRFSPPDDNYGINMCPSGGLTESL